MGGDIYVNTIISTIGDFAGNFGISYVQKCFGTRLSFFMCFLLSAMFAVPLFFTIESYQIAIIVFLVKLFAEGTF